jgi:hypothetical protein
MTAGQCCKKKINKPEKSPVKYVQGTYLFLAPPATDVSTTNVEPKKV